MANINVLIAVDTKSTLAGTTIVYMEDDNPTEDTGEGTSELVANVDPGDTIIWRATSINQSDTVALTEFNDESGNVFGNGGSAPSNNGDGSWTGTVGSYSSGTEESYTFSFSINGSGSYSWDPKIVIKPS
ncbi:MAG: AidA/PixA family protein [Bacteroidota bacterium]